jgi:hypothetical protein
MEDRRKLLALLAVASFGIPLAACSTAQVSQLEATVTDIVQKVQAGVVAAVGTACTWAGKVVPQAQSVMQEVVSLLGSPVAVILEGTAAAAIATITAAITGAVDSISASAIALCPPAPTPNPTPAPTALAPAVLTSVTTAKGTLVKFY